jgi:hypothetical protein
MSAVRIVGVKLVPVKIAVPPVAAVYQLKVTPGVVLAAVSVVVVPEQMPGADEPPVAVMVGAIGSGLTVMLIGVRVDDGQPAALSASA